MYRFQLISDIHLEFGLIKRVKRCADTLFMVGDIGFPERSQFREYMAHCSKTFDQVFYVPGNHEYYQDWKTRLGQRKKSIEELNILMRQICYDVGPNVVYLNNDTYDLDEHLRIIGTTLWSNIEPSASPISDSVQIYKNQTELVTHNDIREYHQEAVEFLRHEITQTELDGKRAVVLTHHLPSYSMVLDMYKTDKYKLYNSHFYSNLDHLIRYPVAAWCSGHSHGFNHQTINGVECYVNAHGYPMEDRRGTSLDFTLDVDLVG